MNRTRKKPTEKRGRPKIFDARVRPTIRIAPEIHAAMCERIETIPGPRKTITAVYEHYLRLGLKSEKAKAA